MNLPSYFIADLPPEAELTPRLITEACQTLKQNRDRFLINRPTAEIIAVLCRVAADWRQPENVRRARRNRFLAAGAGERFGHLLRAVHPGKF